MKVLFVVNSRINTPGNIGYRIGKVIDSSTLVRVEKFVFARGGIAKKTSRFWSMGPIGQIPRLLNAFRIYFLREFKSRLWDLRTFNFCFTFFIPRIKKYFSSSDLKIAHVVEYSPYILKILKKMGFLIVLDVPIAPSSYSRRLMEEFGNALGLDPMNYIVPYELQSMELADLISVPSPFVRNELTKIGIAQKKIQIVPFGTDIQLPAKKELAPKEGLDFCFAGIINQRKGVEFLLEAWSSPLFSKDRLHLCGRLTPEIEEVIKKKCLKNIVLPGFVDTSIYFQKCDIYVFPSLLEGSSKSIYEAMSASMPVITTFESGSIVEDGISGFIIPKCNSQKLQEAMLYFKKERAEVLRMGKNAHQRVSHFTWELYSKNYLEIYNSLKNQKGTKFE